MGGAARANALADYCLRKKPRDQLAERGSLRRERCTRNGWTPADETIDKPRPTSRNKGTTDSIGALRGALGPDLFEVDAYWRKNGHVQNGENISRKFFGGVHLESHAAKA